VTGVQTCALPIFMLSDADILFSPRYLSDAVRLLRAFPLSIVCAPMRDLPEESGEVLERATQAGGDLELETWKQWSSIRRAYPVDEHTAICMGYTTVFKEIQGLDEFYEGWAGEDDDLMRRFEHLGLVPRPLSSESFYLHQWHADSRGVGSSAERVRLNREHLRTTYSIIRNDRSWGIPEREREWGAH